MTEVIDLQVFPDAELLAAAAADWLYRRAAASRGCFTVCLAGGSTPRRLYEQLARPARRAGFPWEKVHWFWGDERVVPADHPDSNYGMAYGAFLRAVAVPPRNIHAMPLPNLDPVAWAEAYAQGLKAFYGSDQLDPARPFFDVTLLGLGEDGHTASLFPGSATLTERAAWTAADLGSRSEPRITLTYPILESSAETIFLVTGEAKRTILAEIRRGADLPASRLRPVGTITWFADKAAAG